MPAVPFLKLLVKRVLAYTLYYSGILWVIAEFKLRGKAVVLLYHRVLPPDADSFSADGIIVTPATFAAQMRFLNRHFLLLSIQQFRDALSSQSLSRRTCLVTFDDGWQDNHEYALPILERAGVPAVVFVATAYLGTENTFWQEKLARMLFAVSRSPEAGRDILAELGIPDTRHLNVAAARSLIRDAIASLKRRAPACIDKLVERVGSIISQKLPSVTGHGADRFMSWGNVRELVSGGLVSVGSHAHTHTPLPTLGYLAAKSELIRSRRALENQGMPQVWACAYPNGEVDDAALAAARDSGYSLAFTTMSGHVNMKDDPMRLRRINVHEYGTATNAEFLCRILGFF